MERDIFRARVIHYCLVLRLGELVVVGALECGVIAVTFIVVGTVLMGGWLDPGGKHFVTKEPNQPASCPVA
jgi:hypothetical protein